MNVHKYTIMKWILTAHAHISVFSKMIMKNITSAHYMISHIIKSRNQTKWNLSIEMIMYHLTIQTMNFHFCVAYKINIYIFQYTINYTKFFSRICNSKQSNLCFELFLWLKFYKNAESSNFFFNLWICPWKK